MYQIKFTPTAQKSIKHIDKKYHSTFAKAIDRLSVNPNIGTPLTGKLKALWKLRFSRYRIIYLIKNKQLIIIILDVGHRKEIYKKI
ncbi:MAG: type II toxin-antitoxin system RelE/ParE family toxin [Candidatus Woesebacteria bacterium]|jgi:mRNA interferase RelE/StbE